jgi:protein TonB
MTDFSKWRGSLGIVLSVGIHLALAVILIALPKDKKVHYDTVDLTVTHIRKAPPPPPPLLEPEKPVVEEEKPVVKKKPKAEEPPPPPEEKPKEQEKAAPPVFDLGDNTFALNGQGAGWAMNRSEGNTRFGGVAKKNQPSARGTQPKFAEKKASGNGNNSEYAPVPLADLTRRPEPVGGTVSAPYPAEAKKAGIEGPVVLRVLIDKTGRVRKTQVIKSPSDVLADAARLAMADQMWTPPLDKDGKPVDTVIVWTFRFVLDG